MSYMRGRYYLWRDDEDELHIWNKDGFEDVSGWPMGTDETYDNPPGGIRIPISVMDDYVMMRLAEILVSEKDSIKERVDHCVEMYEGNGGGQTLQHHRDEVVDFLQSFHTG